MQKKTSSKGPFRWGIMGTANIVRTNWPAIYDSGNGVVAAVASRDVARSRQFIKECQKELARFKSEPVALGSYEELIASPDVDGIYIPLPTGIRKQWIIAAAKAGKHIVAEKPCGITAKETAEILAVCKKHRVQFLDGVMFMHGKRLGKLRQVLDDGKSVGKIKRIMSMFSFNGTGDFFKKNIRVNSKLEPSGSLGDLGWYCIRISLWAMNWKMPKEVTGRIISQRAADGSPGPVPTDFSAELMFGDETTAEFFCSFMSPFQQWAHISGANGYLRVKDFVHPQDDHEPVFEVNHSEVRVRNCDCKGKHVKAKGKIQAMNLFRSFVKQVRSGKLNSDWTMWALKTQQVLDACLESGRKGGRAVKVKP